MRKNYSESKFMFLVVNVTKETQIILPKSLVEILALMQKLVALKRTNRLFNPMIYKEASINIGKSLKYEMTI